MCSPRPRRPGETCPQTGGEHDLFQRPDDNEATVAERLKVYDEKTRPLAQFYAERGLLQRIDAEGELDAGHRTPRGRAGGGDRGPPRQPARKPAARPAGSKPAPKKPANEVRREEKTGGAEEAAEEALEEEGSARDRACNRR